MTETATSSSASSSFVSSTLQRRPRVYVQRASLNGGGSVSQSGGSQQSHSSSWISSSAQLSGGVGVNRNSIRRGAYGGSLLTLSSPSCTSTPPPPPAPSGATVHFTSLTSLHPPPPPFHHQQHRVRAATLQRQSTSAAASATNTNTKLGGTQQLSQLKDTLRKVEAQVAEQLRLIRAELSAAELAETGRAFDRSRSAESLMYSPIPDVPRLRLPAAPLASTSDGMLPPPPPLPPRTYRRPSLCCTSLTNLSQTGSLNTIIPPPKPHRTFVQDGGSGGQGRLSPIDDDNEETVESPSSSLSSSAPPVPIAECAQLQLCGALGEQALLQHLRSHYERQCYWFYHNELWLYVNPHYGKGHISRRLAECLRDDLTTHQHVGLTFTGDCQTSHSALVRETLQLFSRSTPDKNENVDKTVAGILDALAKILSVLGAETGGSSKLIVWWQLRLSEGRRLFGGRVKVLQPCSKRLSKLCGFQQTARNGERGDVHGLRDSLEALCIPAVDVLRLMRAVSLLHRLHFVPSAGNALIVDDVQPASDLEETSKLLGISSLAAYRLLTRRHHHHHGVSTPRTPASAAHLRDSLCAAIQSRLISLIVRRANTLLELATHASLVPSGTLPRTRQSDSAVPPPHLLANMSSLSVFDFPHLTAGSGTSTAPGFEEMCCNLAAERMHHFLAARSMRPNMVSGLVAESDVLHDCLSPNFGLLYLLDEQCERPTGSGSSFVDAIKSQQSAYKTVSVINQNSFIIRHFGAHRPVCYTVDELLEKNRNLLPVELIRLFHPKRNDFKFGQQLFVDDQRRVEADAELEFVPMVVFDDTPLDRDLTFCEQFAFQLDDMMATFESTQVMHTVHCIKTNAKSLPGGLDDRVVLEQLRTWQLVRTISRTAALASTRRPPVPPPPTSTSPLHYAERAIDVVDPLTTSSNNNDSNNKNNNNNNNNDGDDDDDATSDSYVPSPPRLPSQVGGTFVRHQHHHFPQWRSMLVNFKDDAAGVILRAGERVRVAGVVPVHSNGSAGSSHPTTLFVVHTARGLRVLVPAQFTRLIT